MLSKLLYKLVEIIAVFHSRIMQLNNAYEYNFSDKQLHFLVIGALGMGMIFVIYPIFKWLAKNDHIMTITWIYVTTLIVVITFAIEIGQKITKTGSMEFADIIFGMAGFLLMFGIFAVIRSVYHLLRELLSQKKDN